MMVGVKCYNYGATWYLVLETALETPSFIKNITLLHNINFTERGLSWEANIASACSNIPCISRNSKIHYCLHKSGLLVWLTKCTTSHPVSLRYVLTFWRRNYFFNFSTPCIQNVNNTGTKYVRIMKQTAFWREENGEYIPCLKYSVPIFVE